MSDLQKIWDHVLWEAFCDGSARLKETKKKKKNRRLFFNWSTCAKNEHKNEKGDQPPFLRLQLSDFLGFAPHQ